MAEPAADAPLTSLPLTPQMGTEAPLVPAAGTGRRAEASAVCYAKGLVLAAAAAGRGGILECRLLPRRLAA